MSSERLPALGTLRERIELLQKSQAIGPEGGHATTYVPLATVWARVRSLSGSLTSLTDGRASKISHSIVIRHRTDLSPGDRIVYRTRPLEVLSVADLNGRRAYLTCRCSETEATG